MKTAWLILIVFCSLINLSFNSDKPGDNFSIIVSSEKSPENASTDWYREAKFGLFLHWGLYSIPAGEWNGQRYYGISEWLMHRAQIPIIEYKKLALEFNPVKFNADEWVEMAVSAGMKYIILTAKHCEGFSMFHSHVSDFNVVDATPFKRDIVGELAEACHKSGIKLGFYYPQEFEWLHPDARGNTWDYPTRKKDLGRYIEEMVKPQLVELLSNYGAVDIIWFDVPNWISPDQSKELTEFVHSLQPGCLVNSRIGNGYGDYLALGDHQLPDTAMNQAFEVLFTHNDSWGYSRLDKNFKSTRDVLMLLAEANSRGGNLLLNIGPKADGSWPEESSQLLSEISEWMSVNSEAIQGTGPSPFPDLSWGYCTSGPGCFYFLVSDWPENGWLRIPDMAISARSASLISTSGDLTLRMDHDDLLIKVPYVKPDPFCTVIKVSYETEPMIKNVRTVMEQYPLQLCPSGSVLTGKTVASHIRWMEKFGDWKYAPLIKEWTVPGDQAEWEFRIVKPGGYKLILDYSYVGKKGSVEGHVTVNNQDYYFQVNHTGDESHHFRKHLIGSIDFNSEGIYKITIGPAEPVGDDAGSFILLRNITIQPIDF